MEMKPAIVYWEDTQLVRREDMPEIPVMKSIGFIKVLKDRVILTHIITPDECFSSQFHTIIPKGCVKKIVKLDWNPME